MDKSENSVKYYKNINQLYLNEFDIPEFNILKNYRLKLINDENYVNDLLISLNMQGNYNNDIDTLIDKIDMLIYCVLVSKLQDKDKHYGLIFGYSNDLELYSKNEPSNKTIKIIKSKVRQYEPIDLTLFRKYNVFKLYDSLNTFDFNNEDKLIDLISDFQDFKAKNKDTENSMLKTKFHKYYINKFK